MVLEYTNRKLLFASRVLAMNTSNINAEINQRSSPLFSRRRRTLTRTIFALAMPLLVVSCGSETSPGDASASSTSTHPETLTALVDAVVNARAMGDDAALTALVAAMVPKKSDVASMVDASAEGGSAFLDAFEFADMPAGDPQLAGFAQAIFDPRDPQRTEIVAHAATVAEIRAYADDGIACAEFPGGMRRFASLLADPAQTWWVVEQVVPGEEDGMKWTTFTKTTDGRWLFMPKPWGSIPN